MPTILDNIQAQRASIQTNVQGIMSNFRGQRAGIMQRGNLGLRMRLGLANGQGPMQRMLYGRQQQTRAAPSRQATQVRTAVRQNVAAQRQMAPQTGSVRPHGGQNLAMYPVKKRADEKTFGAIEMPKTHKTRSMLTGKGY